ncbi:hypothetical protein C2S52_015459 [Perilla frutescens var. hirtella]|nr:hypothetical protein C2S52_015459 [Perilla frutescens var. hirtella]
MCDSWFNEWSPAAMRMYPNNKNSVVGCKVFFNGSSGYEIGEGGDKHTVCLDKKICTCRAWELTGIPCMHAISAMYYSKIDPLSMISKWYHKSTYQKAYEHPILPVPGPKFFRIEEYAPIEPPPFYKMSGRPRKKRVGASNEPSSSSTNTQRERRHKSAAFAAKQVTTKSGVQTREISITTRPKKLQTRRLKNFVIGCHIDLNSGKITINSELASQRVVQEAE